MSINVSGTGASTPNLSQQSNIQPKFKNDDERLESNTSEWSKMEISNSSETVQTTDNTKWVKIGQNASWLGNWTLFIIKIYIFSVTGSKAVLAAMVDSAVDLVSQGVLSLSDIYMNKYHPDYPVGRSRLEALSVLASAFIMTMASVEVIQFSSIDLNGGINGDIPSLDFSVGSMIVLSLVVAIKLALYLYCKWSNNLSRIKSDSMEALAEDHLNDVFSNVAAIVAVSIAFSVKDDKAWWVDPAGAIAISVVIIFRWMAIMVDQVKKIVGHTAPPEFIEQVQKLAIEHDPRLRVDCIRAYHFGARFIVEMEIVLPGNMTVRESHDIALALQHRIESLEDVERAFVHVDHQLRDGLEHKVERKLVQAASNMTGTHSSGEISARQKRSTDVVASL